MTWGAVELELEVEEWLLSLSKSDFGRAAFYIDLLVERGPLLDEPYSKQLRGKLRELRFYMRRDRQRILYFLTSGQRAILQTVFRKQQARERAEIERAERAMVRCLQEGHTAED
jgi:hypothetical protein